MKQELSAKTAPKFSPFNRYAYIAYMVLVIFLFIKGDYEWAFANLGIALVFDPFDPAVKWSQRPLYQKVWLLAHLALTFGGLAYILIF
jgi:hypothetical protein